MRFSRTREFSLQPYQQPKTSIALRTHVSLRDTTPDEFVGITTGRPFGSSLPVLRAQGESRSDRESRIPFSQPPFGKARESDLFPCCIPRKGASDSQISDVVRAEVAS